MNTLPNKSEVKAQYKAIIKAAKELEGLEGNDYYKAQEALNKSLRLFLRTDFSELNTQQLLKVISLVSTHRPVQPHSFLITCASLVR